MNLKEQLLHFTEANHYAIIREAGWQIGVAYFDYEDLCTCALPERILNKKVLSCTLCTNKHFTNPVYDINVSE